MWAALTGLLCLAPLDSALDYDEGAALVDAVIAAQKAGVETLDETGWLTVYADEARWIHARGEEVKTAERALSRTEARERLELRQMLGVRARVFHERVDLAPDGEALVMTADVAIVTDRWTRRYRDVIRLTKQAGGWRIVEHRFWPTEEIVGEVRRRFDKATWKAIDRDYAAARYRAPMSVDHLRGLMDARRFVEARSAAIAAVQRRPDDAEAHRILILAHYEIGELAQARDLVYALKSKGWSLPTDWSMRP